MNFTNRIDDWPAAAATDSPLVSDIQCRSSFIWKLLMGEIRHNDTLLINAGINITDSELLADLAVGIIWRRYINKIVIPILTLVLNVFGMFGSALVLLILQHRNYNGKDTFKFFMVIIATADLMFNFLDVSLTCLLKFTTVTYSSSQANFYTAITLLTFANISSSLSDLSALGLTFGRYLAICCPFYWHGRSKGWKKAMNYALLAIFLPISSWRITETLKYGMSSVDNSKSLPFYYVTLSNFKRTSYFRTLELANQIIVPAVVSVLMIFMTVHTAVLLKRRSTLIQRHSARSTVSSSPNSSQENSVSTFVSEEEEDKEKGGGNNINVLMFVTAFGTTVCEVTYTIVWFSNQILREEVLFSHTCDNKTEIKQRLIGNTHMFMVRDFTNVLEFLNRSNNFYNYFLFSLTFRQQCKQRLREIFSGWKAKVHPSTISLRNGKTNMIKKSINSLTQTNTKTLSL